MNKKILKIGIVITILALMLGGTCYAITESEVQSAVDAGGKEAVSGNLFVWFLCAIAFMKVSQKIDSFMSSLGISVGRTGGSMLGEAMIAARTVGNAFKSGRFSGFGKNSGSGGTAPAGSGFFGGGIGRRMADGAAGMVTGKNSAGGIMASIGQKAYEGSVEKGGSFAAGVIGSVARGDIAKMGTISGANGKTAMESYFGFNANKQSAQTAELNQTSKTMVEHGGATAITNKEEVGGTIGVDAYDGSVSGGAPSESAGFDDTNTMTSGIAEAVPVFSEIEMGGGRITGMETTDDFPEGRQFAMYDSEKYAKPDGSFETVTAVDNSKWYKQYTTPTVERTPYMDMDGKVQYNEKIVEKLPRAPMRKDKM